MGCDIHLLIEYDEGGDSPFSQEDLISQFGEGEIDISRNYFVFNALAGVRGDDLPDPIISPWGIPKIISHEAITSNYSYVIDEGEKIYDDNYELRSHAEDYVKNGYSHYRDHLNKKNGWVSNPDWHSASWLTYRELKAVLDVEYIEEKYFPKELEVVIGTLEVIERLYGPNRSRVIFWFDN